MQNLSERNRVLGILCLAQFAAMLVWYNFSAVLPTLQQEWNLTNEQAGNILGMFQLGYVISVVFTGWLTDRFGGRLVFALCAVETGLAGIGFAFFATDYTSALLWRVLAGIGQGGLYVPGIQLLSRVYPPNERGVAIGIYTGSLLASYAAAYITTAPLSAAFSWQFAILWTSIWALPAAVLVFLLIPGNTERGTKRNHEISSSNTSHASRMWKNRAIWLIIFAYAGHMWELYAFNGWIGAYANQVLRNNGFSVAQSLTYSGMIASACLIMGAVSPFVGGWMSDRYGRCMTATLALSLGGLGSLMFGWLSDSSLWVFIPSGLLYSFLLVADSAIFKAGLTELVSSDQLGSALSLQSVVGFGVTILSPKFFGLVLDGWSWGWAFCMLAIGPAAGAIAMMALYRLPESSVMAGGKK